MSQWVWENPVILLIRIGTNKQKSMALFVNIYLHLVEHFWTFLTKGNPNKHNLMLHIYMFAPHLSVRHKPLYPAT